MSNISSKLIRLFKPLMSLLVICLIAVLITEDRDEFSNFSCIAGSLSPSSFINFCFLNFEIFLLITHIFRISIFIYFHKFILLLIIQYLSLSLIFFPAMKCRLSGMNIAMSVSFKKCLCTVHVSKFYF